MYLQVLNSAVRILDKEMPYLGIYGSLFLTLSLTALTSSASKDNTTILNEANFELFNLETTLITSGTFCVRQKCKQDQDLAK